MNKDKVEAIAILARGFWANNEYGRTTNRNTIVKKWIIFSTGNPVISDYINTQGDLSQMLSPEGKAQMMSYNRAEVTHKRRVLRGLEIMDSLEDDDDIALWEVNYKTIPGALITSSDEYYANYSRGFGLRKGAFVRALADGYGDKQGLCFAIVKLLETRAAIIDDNDKYTLIIKKPDENIKSKTGQIGK